MAVFYTVFDRREQSGKVTELQKFEGVTLLGKKDPTAGIGGSTGQMEDACVVKLETAQAGAAGILEAQQAVQHFYPGLQTSKPVVVAEAAWKEQ